MASAKDTLAEAYARAYEEVIGEPLQPIEEGLLAAKNIPWNSP